MTKWLSIFLRAIVSMFRTRRNLAFENLLLRQQLAVLKNKDVRPQLTQADRIFWAFASRIWSHWRDALHIVRPETVMPLGQASRSDGTETDFAGIGHSNVENVGVRR